MLMTKQGFTYCLATDDGVGGGGGGGGGGMEGKEVKLSILIVHLRYIPTFICSLTQAPAAALSPGHFLNDSFSPLE